MNPQEAKHWLSEMGIRIDDSCCWSLEEQERETKSSVEMLGGVLLGAIILIGCGAMVSLWWFALGGN